MWLVHSDLSRLRAQLIALQLSKRFERREEAKEEGEEAKETGMSRSTLMPKESYMEHHIPRNHGGYGQILSTHSQGHTRT